MIDQLVEKFVGTEWIKNEDSAKRGKHLSTRATPVIPAEWPLRKGILLSFSLAIEPDALILVNACFDCKSSFFAYDNRFSGCQIN